MNPEPDPTGRFIVLRDNRSAIFLSDAAIEGLGAIDPAERWTISPEVAARRFREHATTCRGSGRTYSFSASFPTAQRSSGGVRRERVRDRKLTADRARPGA